jgi:RNA polymerase sigma factor (sigma-70 family)
VGSGRQALTEFDAAYPRLVLAAAGAVQRFFRYDESQVEDAVAETMARTYERWERVGRHASPVGWIAACAKNVCLEQLHRNTRRTGAASRPRGEVDVVDLSEEAAISVTISQALRPLSKRQRDVAVLRYLMNCDEETTADAMSASVGEVTAAARDARRHLRSLLNEVYLDDDAVTP